MSRRLSRLQNLTRYGALLLVPFWAVSGAEPAVDLMTLKDLSIEEIMQIKIPTVYGASKHEQKITDAPSAVSIVTRNEIQAYGYRSFADIIGSVRDFYVSYDRNYGHIGVRGFNRPGDFGGRVLLLINGIRMNEPIYSTIGVVTDFPVDVDMIERVEVIRGAGSSLYGNNAFFAVINVVTRSGGDVNGVEVSGARGSLDSSKGRLSYGRVFGNGLSILLTGTIFDSAGNERLFFPEFNRPETNYGVAQGLDADSFTSGGVSASYKDFTLQANYLSRRKSVPTASSGTAFNDPGFYTIDQNAFVRLSYAHDFDDELSCRGDVSWHSYYYGGDYPYAYDPAEPRTITTYRDLVNAQWWRTEVQVSKQLWQTHHITLGAESQINASLRMASYDIDPRLDYLRLQTATSTFGVYLQDEWQLTKEVALNLGARYDLLEKFGSAFDPRSAVIYQPSDKTSLKFLYGRAFRAPNLFESSYTAVGFRANPNLSPERIQSYEGVIEQSISPSLRLSASVFYNQVTDLISERLDSNAGEIFFDNTQRAETKGVSLEFEAKLPKGISGRTSYTLQETTETATGERLSNSPRHLAKLNLLVPLYRDKVTSGLELQYTSAVTNSRGVVTNGYVLANWTLFSRDLAKNLEVSGSIYNLFDKKYAIPTGPGNLQESIPQDGRIFRLKFTYRY